MSDRTSSLSLEQLIWDLNNPLHQAAPEVIDNIQRQIQRLQREPAAWQTSLDFLNHENSQIRFYGALTLTIKVHTDWEQDKVGEDRKLVDHLLEHVVSSFVRLAAIPDAQFVLQKLCTSLTAIFQKSNAAWALPVRHVLGCTLAGRYLRQDDVGSVGDLLSVSNTIHAHQLKAVLLLATTLAEEKNRVSATGKGHHVAVRMSNNAPDVWELISFCTSFLPTALRGAEISRSSNGLQISVDTGHSLQLAASNIHLIPLWTEYVKQKSSSELTENTISMLDHFKAGIELCLTFFNHADLANTVLQTMTTLEQNSHNLLHKTLPNYAEFITQSEYSATLIQELLSGDFSPDAVGYVDFLEVFMSQVDVTSPVYLQQTQYVEALTQVEKILNCDGVAGVEDTVCQSGLEILSSVVEGYGDWDDTTVFKNEMHALVTRACSSCLQKVQLPLSELSPSTSSWDTDDRAKFQDFRYDVQDFLQNAFGILGTSLLDEIVRRIVDLNTTWSGFEGNLFGLLAFSDNMASEPEAFDHYLDAVFSSMKWQAALSQALEKVRQIMIKFIGENTTYLQHHSNSLVSSLNFLFESLHIEASATAASRAILTLCDAQRAILPEKLPQFIASLSSLSDLEIDARCRIYSGVSAIIQALPSEEAKLQPLNEVLETVRGDATSLLAADLDEQDVRTGATNIVNILAAIGKGLRAPNEVTVETELLDGSDVDYWISGSGAVVQHTALQIYKTLHERARADDDSLFVEATCDFLRSAFTEDQPSPFKFPPSIVLEVLDRHIRLSIAQPDVVLGTASSYVASTNVDKDRDGFVLLLTRILHATQSALSLSRDEGKIVHQEFSAAALDFFGRLLPKWGRTWFSTADAETTLQVVIELALVLVADPDTMTRRAGASFFTSFLESSANSAMVNTSSPSDTTIQNTLQRYGASILAAILHLLGGECARSEIDSLTEPLKRFITKQPLLANRLIKEAVKAESGVLTQKALEATRPEQRARFAAQVEMLRGSRKTNEIVRGFWIDCRGSSFGYVT